MRHDIKQTIDIKEMKDVFSVIGLAGPSGNYYKERLKKHRQVFDFIKQLNKVAGKLSTKRTLTFVDCACGKSYLSFIANYYFTYVKERDVEFVCIDYNQHVIEASKQAAQALGFENMTFICEDIFKVNFPTRPDIVYSLHACDTATDMTVAKGILEEARHIMTVSCCQHSIRKSLKKHPLKAISRHGVYKERLADMISDSMRVLILESRGYAAKVFEYVPSSETPKNVMIRAMWTGNVSNQKSVEKMEACRQLEALFHTQTKVMSYIES